MSDGVRKELGLPVLERAFGLALEGKDGGEPPSKLPDGKRLEPYSGT